MTATGRISRGVALVSAGAVLVPVFALAVVASCAIHLIAWLHRKLA